jgi:hypothetical protein
MISKYYIYVDHWWPGFETKTDANHVGFYEELFLKTNLRNYEITTDINIANVLLNSGKPDDKIRSFKKWAFTINYIGEPVLPDSDKYDLCLTSVNNIHNVVDLPLSIAYIHCNHFLPKLLNREKITNIANNFCAFIVTNGSCAMRNKMFEKLNEYKKVNSMGRFSNNMGGVLHSPYWSNEYHGILRQHKFVICFENTKMETYSTEKIVNPYLGYSIPIYWGSHNIKNIFNENSMLFLQDETEESFENLMNKIIELDNDNDKYLDFINRPVFTEDNLNFWNENYTMDAIGRKIDTVLSIPPHNSSF